jgi:hypothetical protein
MKSRCIDCQKIVSDNSSLYCDKCYSDFTRDMKNIQDKNYQKPLSFTWLRLKMDPKLLEAVNNKIDKGNNKNKSNGKSIITRGVRKKEIVVKAFEKFLRE